MNDNKTKKCSKGTKFGIVLTALTVLWFTIYPPRIGKGEPVSHPKMVRTVPKLPTIDDSLIKEIRSALRRVEQKKCTLQHQQEVINQLTDSIRHEY